MKVATVNKNHVFFEKFPNTNRDLNRTHQNLSMR